MGWFFKKSIKLGPFRFNFSKSGIGVSAGVRGARISIGPRGTHLNVGRGGLYYRQKFGGSKRPAMSHIENSSHDQSKPAHAEIYIEGNEYPSFPKHGPPRIVITLSTLFAIAAIIGLLFSAIFSRSSLTTMRPPEPVEAIVTPLSTPTNQAPSSKSKRRTSAAKAQATVRPATPEASTKPEGVGGKGSDPRPASDFSFEAFAGQRRLPNPSSPPTNRFTVGSTWDDVLRVQGTPDGFTSDSLHYGASEVYFRNQRVINWHNRYPKLRVQLEPQYPATSEYFTVGSTIDDVLSIHGTPDHMSQNVVHYILHYGTSDVFFKNGHVVSWNNRSPKLRVRLEPGR